MKQLEQQNLLIDADDTLWENNVYFERVIEEVKTMLAPFGIAPELFRKHLDALERKHIAIYGYGTLNFTRSLLQTFEELVPSGCDLRHRVESLGLDILNRPLEIIEGVPPTGEVIAVAERVDARLATSAWDVEALTEHEPNVSAAAEVAVFALNLAGKRRQARRGVRRDSLGLTRPSSARATYRGALGPTSQNV